jgi:hypothetical protein
MASTRMRHEHGKTPFRLPDTPMFWRRGYRMKRHEMVVNGDCSHCVALANISSNGRFCLSPLR